MPARDAEHHLRAVLSFYYSVVNVTPEGDSIVSEETLQGLGTDGYSRSLVNILFGSLIRVAFPYGQPITHNTPEPPSKRRKVVKSDPDILPGSTDIMDAADGAAHASVSAPSVGRQRAVAEAGAPSPEQEDVDDGTAEDLEQDDTSTTTGATKTKKKYKLTDFVPDTGYFLAGAIAGGVSRTATAPLDRLKVYLLVNTKSGSETALGAIKQGRPLVALKNAARPFGDAVKDLFQSGGFRGFFAGELIPLPGGRGFCGANRWAMYGR